jgi:antirestriction protein ArdC
MASRAQYEAITASIIKALERGSVPWRKPWRDIPDLQRHPHNVKSGKRYSGLNPWILHSVAEERGYTSQGWLTYKQAQEMGGNVTGQKATTVYFWKFTPITVTDDDGKVKTKTIPLIRMYSVFNVEQCGDVKLPKRETAKPDDTQPEPIEAAQAVIDSFLAVSSLGFDHKGGDRAFYSPKKDRISLPTAKAFKTMDEYYSTAFHELGHSTGHGSRLNRFDNETKLSHFGSEDYSKEELVAEFTSAFLTAEVGINNTLDNSVAYIKNWLGVLRNDPGMAVTAAGKAQAASTHILTAGQPAVEVDESVAA